MNQLFLDCDGVLADFDTAAERTFYQHPREAKDLLGTDEFWNRISSRENEHKCSLPRM
jgi:beta-phosphoglucomutase-like phosphatase (HAD superfamily)